MQIPFIYRPVGKFSRQMAVLALMAIVASASGAAPAFAEADPSASGEVNVRWDEFAKGTVERIEKDRTDGVSYVLSGSLALIGGLVGQGLSVDPLEQGVYTIFQTIGIASIGFGVYQWKLGNDDRMFYETVSGASGLSAGQRDSLTTSYFGVRSNRDRQKRFIRALTHGLIAAVNIYGATQQKNDSIKNALYFVGGVNLLAVLSFTF